MGVDEFILQIANEALLLTLLVSGPPVLFSLLVGLMIALFQAVTQVQEQSLTFVPKVVVVFLTLALLGAWLGGALKQFGEICFEGFAVAIGN